MEILVPLTFFAMIAALVIVPRYFKSIERQKVADTLRTALERGEPLPPELIDALQTDTGSKSLPPSPQRDLRTGIIWLGIGIGLACFAVAVSFEEADALYPMLGISAFPIFIGLAFILLGVLGKSKSS
ncbi:DUF6249 domain-containing protein [Phenylobacterium sp. SCN 70-31]|uniref:DUF6249 domain-containing protein n=1 Tax=Phenylobacterium sp. SCN 70-31 TaxID=1660129 RepID=UPI000A73FD53|nr:DUF6249 domain-containing protein [Phenylobacterium sp. SCN 70-31]